MDLGAIVRNPDDGLITFTFGPSPRKLSGMAQLLQTLVIELMSDPLPSLGRGSGFVSVLRNALIDDEGVVSANANRALDTAKAHVLQYQSDDTTLRDSERLLDVRLRRIYWADNKWFTDLELKSVSGSRFVFSAA
jgi:hypothetical protein